MDYTFFDDSDIYVRGSADPQALTPKERLVYLVQELEVVADMEGWDHFFITGTARYFNELKAGLSDAGDTASLAVLMGYEQQFSALGVSMEPSPLERFLVAQDDAFFANDRDWRDEFSIIREQRWEKVRNYLSDKHIHLSR